MSSLCNGNLQGSLSVGQGERGKSLEFTWEGTKLGIRVEGQEEYQFVDLGIDANAKEIQLQVSNGYIQWKYSDEVEWKNLISIDELKGEQGIPGTNGKSAYELWLEQGNEGTVEDFLVSLKGKDGEKGEQGIQGERGLQGEKGEQGDKGDTGEQGLPGSNGVDGKDGVTPNIQIGTVTTLEPGQNATVTRRGDNENPIFDFAIPKGQDGGGSGGTSIDDTTISKDKTWSSAKIEDFVLTNVGVLWKDINGSQFVIDNSMEGFLRDVEILGNTIQNEEDLSDIQHLGVWNEEKQGYEIEIKVANSNSEDDLNYEEYKTTIVLPCQLMKVGEISDRLYWDNGKGRYVVEKNIFDSDVTTVRAYAKKTIEDVNYVCFWQMNQTFCTTNVKQQKSQNAIIEGMNEYKEGNTMVSGLIEEEKFLSLGYTLDNNGVKKYIADYPTKFYYATALTPQLIDTDVREELKLPAFINKTYITVAGGVQGSIKCKAPVDGSVLVETLQLENKELQLVNQEQDELINISLCATDEIFMMIEPLLVQNYNLVEVSKMVDLYVCMVQRGIKNIEDVPARYREQVAELLRQLED